MRHFSALTIAGLVAVSLTACGGSDSAGSGSGTPGAKASTSTAPKTLALAEVAGLVHNQLKNKKSVRMNVDSGDGSQGTVAVSTENGTPALEIKMTSEGKALRLIKTKNAVFMEEKDPKEQLAPGKTFIRFAADSKNPLAKLMVALVGAMSSIADTEQHRALMASGGTLAGPVTDKVVDTPAQRYTVSIDMAKALETIDLRKYLASNVALAQQVTKGLGVKNDPSVDKLAKLSDADLAKLKANMLKAVAGKPLTYEIWADAQNVPLKFSVEAPTKTRDKTTVTLFDWGIAPVTAPPAELVADMPDLN
ncbi:hypothetical protein [Actinomadura rudentiformis]|uniref:LppX_LprAFG lipoprotein n=1 Tax=Actinomadura rudentiformis TaxID=359158 RepID=A0A6H9YTG4_9ACTN|nr:hypothetical protein [Actinomadura rudentiformis]KAB2347460.1 hypothetical protein F8566_20915 [Actinomadura rudentiformis]